MTECTPAPVALVPAILSLVSLRLYATCGTIGNVSRGCKLFCHWQLHCCTATARSYGHTHHCLPIWLAHCNLWFELCLHIVCGLRWRERKFSEDYRDSSVVCWESSLGGGGHCWRLLWWPKCLIISLSSSASVTSHLLVASIIIDIVGGSYLHLCRFFCWGVWLCLGRSCEHSTGRYDVWYLVFNYIWPF